MQITGVVLDEIGQPRPYKKTQPLAIKEVDLAEPGEGEVLIKIKAAGLCHSDLSVIEGNRPRPTPMLLGHEAAGIVEKVGPGVNDLEPGEHVTAVFLPRCGNCQNCKTNGKLPCTPGTASNEAGELPGGTRRLSASGEDIYHHVGVSGFATHAVINRQSLVPIPHDVPWDIAAVVGCAVLTGGGAVVNAANPEEGDSLMVVGLGGVGMASLLTAVSLSRGPVIGVDANVDKLSLAEEYGATETYTPDQLAEIGVKAPFVIEAAGNHKAFETAFYSTAVGGTTVTIGLPAPNAVAEIPPVKITSEARTIIGSYLGSSVPSEDIPMYLEMWRNGKLPIERLISSNIRLDQVNEAMDKLANGEAIRQVIMFD